MSIIRRCFVVVILAMMNMSYTWSEVEFFCGSTGITSGVHDNIVVYNQFPEYPPVLWGFGYARSISAYDSSRVELTSGDMVDYLNNYDQSCTTLYSGIIDTLGLYNQSTFNFEYYGDVTNIVAHDSSVVNFNSDFCGTQNVEADGFSTINLKKGHLISCSMRGRTLNVDGGSIFDLKCGRRTTFNMTSGRVSFISAMGSTLNIYGGEICEINCSGNALVNLYGYGFELGSDNMDYQDGLRWKFISGFMENGEQFCMRISQSIIDDHDYLSLHTIPEPATMAMFLLGGLALARRRKH